MTERYLFPLGECLACIRGRVSPELLQTINCSPADVIQSALEEFGIEFNIPFCMTIDQILLTAGTDSTVAYEVNEEIMRLLRRVLPWTEGGPRHGEGRLLGYIEFETLMVTHLDPELPDPMALNETDWYPERYRRISELNNR